MSQVMIEARKIYEAIAFDLGDHDLETAIDAVGDRLYEKYGSNKDVAENVRKALRQYF